MNRRIHCSLGCNTITDVRYRAVMQIEARLNEAVEGYFICDRGGLVFPMPIIRYMAMRSAFSRASSKALFSSTKLAYPDLSLMTSAIFVITLQLPVFLSESGVTGSMLRNPSL
jgi:hypothetical protein